MNAENPPPAGGTPETPPAANAASAEDAPVPSAAAPATGGAAPRSLALSPAELAADRDLMSQVLTFCSFIGGISLAALLASLLSASDFLGLDSDSLSALTGGELASANLAIKAKVLWLLMGFLALTSAFSLIGAFFAVLGHTHYAGLSGLLERFARPAGLTDREARSFLGKYAVFRQFFFLCRGFAVFSMATGLGLIVVVCFVIATRTMFWLLPSGLGVGLLAIYALRQRAQRTMQRYGRLAIGDTTWVAQTDAPHHR